MTGGARRFGRRCRHDFEVAETHHHEVGQQPRPQQSTAEQPRTTDTDQRNPGRENQR
ncbi:hypothetical protein [Amycolatopsis albispora]|uniref:hypothetical protein n=1 Tax=Amycolatopsis albispora TaxID=1804986 RepID=UPI0013B3A47B|nr:hypothetical protein [Amycolatopsis albispora]